MVKIIATDMDGTLLDILHMVNGKHIPRKLVHSFCVLIRRITFVIDPL